MLTSLLSDCLQLKHLCLKLVGLHTHCEWPLDSHPRALKILPTQQVVHVDDVPLLSLLSTTKDSI